MFILQQLLEIQSCIILYLTSLRIPAIHGAKATIKIRPPGMLCFIKQNVPGGSDFYWVH